MPILLEYHKTRTPKESSYRTELKNLLAEKIDDPETQNYIQLYKTTY